jgi:hypothetical protein
MTYRRYPNRERALSQLGRHHPAPPRSEMQRQLAVGAFAALEAAGRILGEFVVSVRQGARA